ncbi:hypothetical protein QT971_01125 [Microcoleus sp. herbarium19]|uniref:hypothetical protein n=1 Tax=unclassified Microcoleus TaxID=2642155 RepID=UPI002FD4B55C
MNESNVIILSIAANPSKDINSASKKILPAKQEMESADRRFSFRPSTDIKPRHLRVSGFL